MLYIFPYIHFKQELSFQMTAAFYGPQLAQETKRCTIAQSKQAPPSTVETWEQEEVTMVQTGVSHGTLSLLLIRVRVACLLRSLEVWAFQALLCRGALYVDSLCLCRFSWTRKREQTIWKGIVWAFEDYRPAEAIGRMDGFKLWTGLKSSCTVSMLAGALLSLTSDYSVVIIQHLFLLQVC